MAVSLRLCCELTAVRDVTTPYCTRVSVRFIVVSDPPFFPNVLLEVRVRPPLLDIFNQL